MAKRKKVGVDSSVFLRSVGKGELLPVYAFVGENAYLAHRCTEALRKRFADEGAAEAVSIFVGDEPAEVIFDQLRTADLFVSRRLVVILQGDVFIKSNADAITFYLEHPSSGCVLALVCLSLDSRTRLVKRMKKVGCLVDCVKLYADRVAPWVRQRFADRRKPCAAGVAEMLIDEVGEDLFALEAEVEKLCAYVGGRGCVEVKDVLALVGHDHHWEVFALTEAVGQRDARRALGVLADMMDEGARPEQLVAQLAWQLRRLWTAKRHRDQGMTPEQVGRALRVHPRFLTGFIEQTDRFSQTELSRLYRGLARTDVALKTGRLNRRLAIERFVVQACEKRGHSTF